jgi:hypothetical protein
MKAIAESATKRFLGCHAKNPARYVTLETHDRLKIDYSRARSF